MPGEELQGVKIPRWISHKIFKKATAGTSTVIRKSGCINHRPHALPTTAACTRLISKGTVCIIILTVSVRETMARFSQTYRSLSQTLVHHSLQLADETER